MKIIRSTNDLTEASPLFQCVTIKPTELSKEDTIQTAFVPQHSVGPWEISPEALQNTLHYIFDHLHHSCYLLCSDGKKSTLVKLESSTTSPFLKNTLLAELSQLNQNKTITEGQKKTIRKNTEDVDSLRIMQCIVKKFKAETTTSLEYETFVQNIRVPAGIYVMNLTDANLLSKKGLEPFPLYRGSPPLLPAEFQSGTPFLPILSLSGNIHYSDIPIPNYDDVTYILNPPYDIRTFTTEWSKKNIAKAVFRGGPSGCGYTIETNQRLRLASMANSSPDLDVGIVASSVNQSINSNSIRFDPVHGLGMLNTGIKSVNRLSYVQQSQYKYIIHVDGNVNAYRLLSILATGSLVLRVKSDFTSWFEHLIHPDQHYIEVREDLSDLLEKVEWCKGHDAECQRIASNGLSFAQEALNPDYIRGAFQKIVVEARGVTNTDKSSFYLKSNEKCEAGYTEDPKNKDRCNRITKKIKIKQPTTDSFYTKGLGERCKKGYTQDKKDKTKCIISAKQKINTSIKKVTPTLQSLDEYTKGENEKKCKKGYVQDKKDKQKCVSPPSAKTQKIKNTNTKTKKVVNPMPEADENESSAIRQKCEGLKLKLKNTLKSMHYPT